MIPTVRIYASEETASEAARACEEAGFDPICLLTPTAVAGRERQAVAAAVGTQCIAASQVRFCVEALLQGQSVVGVYTLFGQGLDAEQLLAQYEGVAAVELPRTNDPAPLSRVLGLPVLARYTPMTELSVFRFMFGEPRLSQNPAPLTSLFGLKPLVGVYKRKNSSFGIPLLTRSKSKNSSFGMPLLTRSKSKDSSFGLPLLSRNATPISSLFGLRVLSKKDDGERS